MKLISLVQLIFLLSTVRASAFDCSQYNENQQSCLNENNQCAWVTVNTCTDSCYTLNSYAACSAKGNACQSYNALCAPKINCPSLSDTQCATTTESCTLTAPGKCIFLNNTNPCIVDDNTPCNTDQCKDTAQCKLAGAIDCSVNTNQNGCNVPGCSFSSKTTCSNVTPGTISHQKMIAFCFSLLVFFVFF